MSLSRVLVLGLLVAIAAAIVAFAAVRYGARRWAADTAELRSRLAAERSAPVVGTVDLSALDGLPAPVQRYFRAALTDGQPAVAAATLRHTGTFNTSEASDSWKPFTSDQLVVTSRPGFDWNGRIAMAPGIAAFVHDAYIGGEGILHASLLGLKSLARQSDRGAVAEGELMRFVAEAAWYPTALLPRPGVVWEAADDRSARVTLSDSGMRASLAFVFGDDDLIESVRTDSRGRMVGGQLVSTAWEGRFWNYAVRDGMRIPLDGEVAWLPPEGAKPYWRGHLVSIAYEFATRPKP